MTEGLHAAFEREVREEVAAEEGDRLTVALLLGVLAGIGSTLLYCAGRRRCR